MSLNEPEGGYIPPIPRNDSNFAPSLDDYSAPGTPAVGGTLATPDASNPFLGAGERRYSAPALRDEPNENTPIAGGYAAAAPTSKKRPLWQYLAAATAVLIVVVLAVILPVYFTVIKPHNDKSSSSSSDSRGSSTGSSGPQSNPESPNGAVTGGNGSVITTADNVTFTYLNEFGGFWVDDPRNPYNSSAQAQSYTPPLNQKWDYTNDRVQGVNLGGWLVLEPFIVPALFQKYQNVTPSVALPGGNVVDEWSLSVAMLNDTSEGGGIQQIEDHYRTFITEQDFAEIAGAGLNWVRLPIPYWAIETWPGEPFLANTAWNYVLLALKWARKYGLRMYAELHTVPGSQNGLNHSGRSGTINFLNGPMGMANADRTMGYIRLLVEFFSQEQYTDVVQMFGVVNEPLLGDIGLDQLTRFYLQSHDMIREITGIGNGAAMIIHDGFQALGTWADFLPGSDRIFLDTHPYIAFGGGLDEPVDFWAPQVCTSFLTNTSQAQFGVTLSGEFSAAVNDCGLWVKGVNVNASYPDCGPFNDWENWNDTMRESIMNFTMAEMDAMHTGGGWFFWTWKIGNESVTGTVQAPMWSYQLGLQNGWIPKDPRTALGICESLGVAQNQPWNGSYQSWQTGGAGAGTIAATALESFSAYPPPQISNADNANPSLLPYYTMTSRQPTLPAPTFYTAATASAGDGWADPSDTALAYAPIQGCSYYNGWFAPAESTAFICNGQPAPTPTPPPA